MQYPPDVGGTCLTLIVLVSSERATQNPEVAVHQWPDKAARVKKRTEHVWTSVVLLRPKDSEPMYVLVKRPDSGLLA
eukprot:scaffold395839_cov43-Prasinocladus_malaysianus.AAC.1